MAFATTSRTWRSHATTSRWLNDFDAFTVGIWGERREKGAKSVKIVQIAAHIYKQIVIHRYRTHCVHHRAARAFTALSLSLYRVFGQNGSSLLKVSSYTAIMR